MTTIWIEPDEQKSSSLIAQLKGKTSPGLEEITGADFAVSKLPMKINKDTIDWHVENLTFFIQRKSGYDLFSFDALKRAIARMKACHIPSQQAILLSVGHFYPNDDGLCICNSKQPYGQTTYASYQGLLARWIGRGGVHYNVNSEEDIPDFIEGLTGAYKKMAKGGRTIVADQPTLEAETLFQRVEELGPLDFRRILRIGLEGYGETLAQNTQALLGKYSYPSNLFMALTVLTGLSEKGKMVYNIKGWGMKSCLKLREILGLKTFPKGEGQSVENLSTADHWNGTDSRQQGWLDCVQKIKELAETDKNGAEIMEIVEKEVIPF